MSLKVMLLRVLPLREINLEKTKKLTHGTIIHHLSQAVRHRHVGGAMIAAQLQVYQRVVVIHISYDFACNSLMQWHCCHCIYYFCT